MSRMSRTVKATRRNTDKQGDCLMDKQTLNELLDNWKNAILNKKPDKQIKKIKAQYIEGFRKYKKIYSKQLKENAAKQK